MPSYDAIVIGAGEAGGDAIAEAALAAGHRVALVTKRPYGSTCLNTGCVPSKYILHRAGIAHALRTAEQYHVRAGPVKADWPCLAREIKGKVDGWRRQSLREAHQTPRLTLVLGAATFEGPHTVRAAGRKLTAPRIFVCTGARPAIPDIEGLGDVPFETSDTILYRPTLPQHLLVVGGGYIACELGQAFARFGSKVTILQSHDRLMPDEEPPVGKTLQEAFAQEGIEVQTGLRAHSVRRRGQRLELTAKPRSGRPKTFVGTDLLVATGRKPNTEGLNLEVARVDTDAKGHIIVDDQLRTTAPGIWAAGDVTGVQPFTRAVQQAGRIAYENAFTNSRKSMPWSVFPHAAFTDPPMARVGATAEQAKKEGWDVRTATVTMAQVSRADLMGRTAGFIRYVIDRESQRLLGCTVMGERADDLIMTPTSLMRRNAPITEIAETIGVYPTVHEGLEKTAAAYLKQE